MTEHQPQFINNRYRVDKKLGEGGMGAVYRVADTQHGDQMLALKIMKKLGGDDEDSYHRLFKREFEVLAGLNHPHVAQAYDYGPILDGSGYFFTSEFVQGIDLLGGTKGVGLENLIEVMVQACRAIDYVHSRGLIHHDLKPDNILLTEPQTVEIDGGETPEARELRREILDFEQYLGELMIEKRIVKIIDFGLIMGEREDNTRLFGTPQYMPPEKIRRERCGKPGDLYSLGVVFYQIFTRRLPFVATSIKDLFHRITDEEPVPPRKLLPELPQTIEDIIMRLMDKNPARRYSKAGEIIHELNVSLGRDYSLETSISAEGYIASGKFVGRAGELQEIRSSSDAITQGKAGTDSPVRLFNTFLVSGEKGIGKTRFIREIKMGFQLQDNFLLDIEVERFRDNIPLFIRELLMDLEEIPSFLNLVSDVELQQARAFADEEDGGSVPDEIMSFLAKAVMSVSRLQPVCCVVSNLAGGDVGMIRFVIALADLIARARVQRPDGQTTAGNESKVVMVLELPSELDEHNLVNRFKADFTNPEKFKSIVLERLSFDEVGTVIATMFGQGYVPRGFIEKLYDASHGNPQYMFEVLMDLTTLRKISKVGRNWTFDKNIDAIDIPPSYRAEIVRMVQSLDRETRRIIEVLGIVRELVPITMIRDFTDFDEEMIRFRLSVMLKRKLITAETKDGTENYKLAFDFLYEIVQKGMAEHVREDLSRKMGMIYEDRLRYDNQGLLCVPLAELFIELKDIERSVRYGLQAGEQLTAEGRHPETLNIYKKLIPLFTPKDYIPFIKVASKLAEIYELNGEFRSAIDMYSLILEKGEVILKGWNKALLFRKIAHLHISLGDHGTAVEQLRQGQQFIITGQESLEAGLFLSSEALAQFRLGNYRQSMEHCLKAEYLIQTYDDHTPRVKKEMVSNNLIKAGILYYTGELAQSRVLLEGLRDECESLEFESALGTVLTFLGLIAIEDGDFEVGGNLEHAALQIYKERIDDLSLQEVNLSISQQLLYENKYMECLERIEKILLNAVGREGYANIAGKAYLIMGQLNRFFGRHTAAKLNFQHSLDFFNQSKNEFLNCEAIIYLARSLVDINAFEQALTYLNRVDQLVTDRDYVSLRTQILHIKGIIAYKQNQFEEGQKIFAEFERTAAQSELNYRNTFFRNERLLYQTLMYPDRIDVDLFMSLQASPYAQVPVIKASLSFIAGIKANQADNREQAWINIYEAQSISLKYHFMELLWISNYELNKLHVLKTGNVSNRFLNAARRALQQISDNLEDEDSRTYMSSSVIQTTNVMIVDTGADSIDGAASSGDIWQQQTMAGGAAPQARTQGVDHATQATRGKSDSSGYIGNHILQEATQAGFDSQLPTQPGADSGMTPTIAEGMSPPLDVTVNAEPLPGDTDPQVNFGQTIPLPPAEPGGDATIAGFGETDAVPDQTVDFAASENLDQTMDFDGFNSETDDADQMDDIATDPDLDKTMNPDQQGDLGRTMDVPPEAWDAGTDTEHTVDLTDADELSTATVTELPAGIMPPPPPPGAGIMPPPSGTQPVPPPPPAGAMPAPSPPSTAAAPASGPGLGGRAMPPPPPGFQKATREPDYARSEKGVEDTYSSSSGSVPTIAVPSSEPISPPAGSPPPLSPDRVLPAPPPGPENKPATGIERRAVPPPLPPGASGEVHAYMPPVLPPRDPASPPAAPAQEQDGQDKPVPPASAGKKTPKPPSAGGVDWTGLHLKQQGENKDNE